MSVPLPFVRDPLARYDPRVCKKRTRNWAKWERKALRKIERRKQREQERLKQEALARLRDESSYSTLTSRTRSSDGGTRTETYSQASSRSGGTSAYSDDSRDDYSDVNSDYEGSDSSFDSDEDSDEFYSSDESSDDSDSSSDELSSSSDDEDDDDDASDGEDSDQERTVRFDDEIQVAEVPTSDQIMQAFEETESPMAASHAAGGNPLGSADSDRGEIANRTSGKDEAEGEGEGTDDGEAEGKGEGGGQGESGRDDEEERQVGEPTADPDEGGKSAENTETQQQGDDMNEGGEDNDDQEQAQQQNRTPEEAVLDGSNRGEPGAPSVATGSAVLSDATPSGSSVLPRLPLRGEGIRDDVSVLTTDTRERKNDPLGGGAARASENGSQTSRSDSTAVSSLSAFSGKGKRRARSPERVPQTRLQHLAATLRLRMDSLGALVGGSKHKRGKKGRKAKKNKRDKEGRLENGLPTRGVLPGCDPAGEFYGTIRRPRYGQLDRSDMDEYLEFLEHFDFKQLTRADKREIRRARERMNRRHRGLSRFEERLQEEVIRVRAEHAAKAERARIDAQLARHHERKWEAGRKFAKRVRKNDLSRYQKELEHRKGQYRKQLYQLAWYEKWGMEKIEHERAEKEASEKKRQEDMRARSYEERVKKKAAAERAKEERLLESEQATQATLQLMRGTGAIAAVNTPAAHEPMAQRETNKVVTLRVRRPEPGELMRPGVTKQFFAIDLHRYRNMEVLCAEMIGEAGAVALSKELLKGAGARLRVLKLNSCDIRKRGFEAIMVALRGGACTRLREIEMRASGLSPDSCKYLLKMLKSGALTDLEVLDLRGNRIGGAGALDFATMMIKGYLPNLRRLLLQANEINDEGIEAIYRAVTAANFTNWCPSMDQINLTQNWGTPMHLATLRPCPLVLRM